MKNMETRIASRPLRLLYAAPVVLALGGQVPADAAVNPPYVPQYATYFGGTDWDRVQSVFLDSAGNIYIGGSTKSANFPTTPGAYDRTGESGSANDGYVAKFSSAGQLIWSTFLHGSVRDDVYGVRVDPQGNVIVSGSTYSSDFPTTPGAYDRTLAGDKDVFIAKLSGDGSTLLWCTLLGGAAPENCRGGTAVDASGRVHVSGYTESAAFPTTAGAYQTTYRGGAGDAFVCILSADGSTLLRSTFLGGTGPDHGLSGIALHSDGTISVAGAAGSSNFPTTPGAYQTTFGGTAGVGRWPGDAFVARLSADLSSLVFSTYLGGSGDETVAAQNSFTMGPSEQLLIAGRTTSPNLPATPGATQQSLNGSEDLYVAVLSSDGARLDALTYLGGAQDGPMEASGLRMNVSGDVFLGGWTTERDFPLTPDAFQSTHAGGEDVVLLGLTGALQVRYATFLGGSGGVGTGLERGRGVWLDTDGTVVTVGDTNSSDFPMAGTPHQPTQRGNGDGFIARLAPAGPIIARLSEFSGVLSSSGVLLTWSTTEENELDGFHVYRGATPVGPFVQLTSALVRGSSPYTFTDAGAPAAEDKYYRLGAVGLSGSEEFHGPVLVAGAGVSLGRARPNPFLDDVDFSFWLPNSAHVSVQIYDLTGRRLRGLVDTTYPAGQHLARWDGRDENGDRVPAGIYVSRFQSGGVVRAQKVVNLGGTP